MQGEYIAVHVAFLGCLSGKVNGAVGQSFKFCLVCDVQDEAIGVPEFVLGELE